MTARSALRKLPRPWKSQTISTADLENARARFPQLQQRRRRLIEA